MQPVFRILLTAITCLVVVLGQPWMFHFFATAQAPTGDLFYTYFGKRVPLTLRQDVIAAKSKPASQRGDAGAFYLTLQQQLSGKSVRGESDETVALEVEVKPLGEEYALISLPKAALTRRTQIQQQVQAAPAVEAIVPVLTRPEAPSDVIVLPNRILVNFQSSVTPTQIDALLKRQNLAILNKEPFADRLYLVRSTVESGTAILTVANQLGQLPEVEYATPDFIQAASTRFSARELKSTSAASGRSKLVEILAKLQANRAAPQPTALFPLLWNFNSTSFSACLDSKATLDCLLKAPAKQAAVTRTDIHAMEAWQRTPTQGRGVVVAVIDSLIQMDHPDLQSNLYTIKNPQCPGEAHGWDFTNETKAGNCLGDPETTIDAAELKILRPLWQDSFRLSDTDLIQHYPKDAENIKTEFCKQSKCSPAGIANVLRQELQDYGERSFHGTMVAGVLGAKSPNGKGLIGTAPNVSILPIRALGLGGAGSTVSLQRAIGYAADRGADIINMSLGPANPIIDEAVTRKIANVLAAHPKLMIVASAGNEGDGSNAPDVVRFPACVPGVVSAGATNLKGNRAYYSNYGTATWKTSQGQVCGQNLKSLLPQLDNDDVGLDVVAPGGDFQSPKAIAGIPLGGVLSTGGTFVDGLWQGITPPDSWGTALDPKGNYAWTQGTSFAAPTVTGVLALMKGEDPKRTLTRQQLVAILKQTASYDSLKPSASDANQYRTLTQQKELPTSISANQFFFGRGLVNADSAVQEVQRRVKE